MNLLPLLLGFLLLGKVNKQDKKQAFDLVFVVLQIFALFQIWQGLSKGSLLQNFYPRHLHFCQAVLLREATDLQRLDLTKFATNQKPVFCLVC